MRTCADAIHAPHPLGRATISVTLCRPATSTTAASNSSGGVNAAATDAIQGRWPSYRLRPPESVRNRAHCKCSDSAHEHLSPCSREVDSPAIPELLGHPHPRIAAGVVEEALPIRGVVVLRFVHLRLRVHVVSGARQAAGCRVGVSDRPGALHKRYHPSHRSHTGALRLCGQWSAAARTVLRRIESCPGAESVKRS